LFHVRVRSFPEADRRKKTRGRSGGSADATRANDANIGAIPANKLIQERFSTGGIHWITCTRASGEAESATSIVMEVGIHPLYNGSHGRVLPGLGRVEDGETAGWPAVGEQDRLAGSVAHTFIPGASRRRRTEDEEERNE